MLGSFSRDMIFTSLWKSVLLDEVIQMTWS
jgi:hypothetical protein